MDDELWMARVARGDKHAFGLIVKSHQEPLQRFAGRMLGDREAASDVVQEVFVRLWQFRDAYQETGRLIPFLFRLVRNACSDYLRTNKRWEAVRLDDDVPFAGVSCEANALSSELYKAIERALLRLTEAQRAVFVLSEYEGLTYQEIAEVVGCPVGTVASRKYTAMEMLRAELRPWQEGSDT